MLINLLHAFTTNISSKSKVGDVQTSFHFERAPSVIFVKNIQTLEKIDYYDELNEYQFSQSDREKINRTIKSIESSGGYDGNQLLIENLSHDLELNILYIEARQAKYSFIKTLQKSVDDGGFDQTSAFYKKIFCTAGVRAPFITEDNYTFFMMRTRSPKVYSVAAGLLEAPQNGKLHPKESRKNLVSYVAYHEALEEFIGDPKLCHKSLRKQLLHARVKINQLGLSAIAMRRADQSVRIEVEFINPFQVSCDHKTMQKIIAHNKAKDAYEHVSTQSIALPLHAEERHHAIEILNQAPDEGKFVRDPIVAVTSMLANQHCRFFPRVLPGKLTTEFVPIATLALTIEKPPSIQSIMEESDLENDELYDCQSAPQRDHRFAP